MQDSKESKSSSYLYTVNIDRNLILKVMSDSKTYVFDSGANNNGLLASILPALQNRGIDSSYLMGLMSGNGNGGFFGNNGGFQDIIALIVIAAIFGNGNFGFGGFGNNNGGANLVASTAEREMLLSAIQRNGVDISQLASSLNCSVGRINDAIGQVATQICNLTGQVGMSSQQIINSVQFGNSQLANQIANCCCDLKSALSSCCCDIQRDIASSVAATTRGFADVGYALRDQTCNIEKAIEASTGRILDGQRAAEMREMQNRIDMLREKNGTLTTQLNLEHQNQYTAGVVAQSIAPVNAALGDLSARLAKIECKQPETVTIPYIPAMGNYIPVNYSIPVHFGQNYGCGYNYGNC